MTVHKEQVQPIPVSAVPGRVQVGVEKRIVGAGKTDLHGFFTYMQDLADFMTGTIAGVIGSIIVIGTGKRQLVRGITKFLEQLVIETKPSFRRTAKERPVVRADVRVLQTGRSTKGAWGQPLPEKGNVSRLSPVYSVITSPTCFKLEVQAIRCALAFALDNAGRSIAARMAMIAITTSSSINVKAMEIFWTRIVFGMVALQDSFHYDDTNQLLSELWQTIHAIYSAAHAERAGSRSDYASTWHHPIYDKCHIAISARVVKLSQPKFATMVDGCSGNDRSSFPDRNLSHVLLRIASNRN